MCNFLHTIRFLHATRCNNCRFSTTLDSVQLLQRVACDKLHTWNHGISRRQIIEWWTPLTRTAPPDTSEPIDPAVAVELAMMLDDVWLIWINSTGTLSALLATCHSFHISHGLLPHSCSQSQHTHTHTHTFNARQEHSADAEKARHVSRWMPLKCKTPHFLYISDHRQ